MHVGNIKTEQIRVEIDLGHSLFGGLAKLEITLNRDEGGGYNATALEAKLLWNKLCYTVKPLLSRHPWDLSKCLLNRGCPLNRGLIVIRVNIMKTLILGADKLST